ncbi:BTAD domain-containing putative transcriptional regulator [Nocardia sp. NPDC059177]|uniref:BTAD domain-containing putative transcriptional regulator n=1 Tax=Nocardia sp. NPDC059177 TaxID=3346759 RepID=UPI0036C52034
MFGPLRVAVNGDFVHPGSPRQRALLTRLVLAAGQVVATDRLIEDIWSGSPPAKAGAALHVHVSNLRRILEPARPARAPARVLVSEPPGYALRLDPAAVDVWRFEATIAAARGSAPAVAHRLLGAALAGWTGDPFAPFADRPWVLPEIARLTELRWTALERRAELSLDLGHPHEALHALAHHVTEHAERESAACLLAVAQYRVGRQLDALATLRRVREQLDREFGVRPGRAVAELETAILTHTVESPPAVRPEPVPVVANPAVEPVGYAGERDALAGEADAVVAAGRARLVWLEGAAGMGKTTLAESMLDRLAARGWSVAGARCPEVDAAPAGWVWQQILGELGGDGELAGAAAGPFALAGSVARGCRTALAHGPLLLVVEDLHRADDVTLQILRQLSTWLRATPVLLIVTTRGQAGPAVHSAATALAPAISRRLALDGLDAAAVAQVARRAGLTPLDRETAEFLRERTGGNPLFVREVADLAAVTGDLRAVPSSVREVLAERIARLPDGVAALLGLVAVWGEEIDFEVLLDWSDAPEATLADLVDAAAAAGLVRLRGRGRIAFGHALIRDAVYQGLPALHRVRLHREATGLLERRLGTDTDRLSWAELDLLAHQAAAAATTAPTAVRALPYVLAAARVRVARGAHADAVGLWRTAGELHVLAGHERPTATLADRLAALRTRCALITALGYAGDDEQALALRADALARARALRADNVTPDPVRTVLTCWRAPTVWRTRDYRFTDDALVAEIFACLDADPTPEQRIRLLITAVFELEADEGARAGECSRRALALARDTGDPELLCAALNARAFVALGPDLWSERRPIAQELAEVAGAAGLADYEAVAHFLLYLVECGVGELVAAADRMALAMACAPGGQLSALLGAEDVRAALIMYLRGEPARGQVMLAERSARMMAAGAANGAAIDLLGRIMAAWAEGDLAPLAPELAQLYAVAPAAGADVYLLALLDAGERERASAVLSVCPPPRRDFHWGSMAAFRARVLVRLGETEQAAALYRELLPRAGTIVGLDSGALAFGPFDDVLAELAELLGDSTAAAAHRRRAHEVQERLSAELRALDRTRSARTATRVG